MRYALAALGLCALLVGASPAYAAETADWLPLKGTYGNAIGCTWEPNGCGLFAHTNGKKGIDFIVDNNTPVYAAGPGEIVRSYNRCNPTNSPACNRGAGNWVVIAHPDDRQSRYLHLSKVVKGSGSVKRGALIGYSGNSGGSPVPHLHYDELINGSLVDPGPMKAVHGDSLVNYPRKLGYETWNAVPHHGGHTVRNDSFKPSGDASWSDFDGNGRDDLAWYHANNQQVTTLLSSGSGFGIDFKARNLGNPTWAGVGDFNGDGKHDLAWYHKENTVITTLLSQGDSFKIGFKASGIGKPTWAGVGDFDGNGKDDLAWYDENNGTVTIILSEGNSFRIGFRAHNIGKPTWAGAGDFNGDGKDDLAWYHRENQAVTTLLSTGNGFNIDFTAKDIGVPTWAGVGDFDGNGKDDLAWYHQENQVITTLLSSGSSFGTGFRATDIGKPTWAGVGDFDGNKKDDLAWYHASNHRVTTILSNGNGFGIGFAANNIGNPTWAGNGGFPLS